MNEARVLPRVAFWSVAALTLAAVCLRTAAFLTGYDGDIGYFRSAAVTVVYRVLCLCVVLIPAVCGMLIPEGGLSAPCIGVGRDLSASIPLIASLITVPFFLQSSSGKAVTPILCAVLAVCAAAHFLLALLGVGNRNVRGLLGFAVILLCMLVIGRTYNDPYVTMNSPVKLAVQFACAGVMLGMTADLRMLLCKPAPRLALTVLSAGSFFGVAGALPCLIARIAGCIPSGRAEGGQLYFVYLCFSALMGIYMLIRLAQCVFAAGASDVPVEAEPEANEGDVTDDLPPQM